MVREKAEIVCWNNKAVIREMAIVSAYNLSRPLTPRPFLTEGHSGFKQWNAPFILPSKLGGPQNVQPERCYSRAYLSLTPLIMFLKRNPALVRIAGRYWLRF